MFNYGELIAIYTALEKFKGNKTEVTFNNKNGAVEYEPVKITELMGKVIDYGNSMITIIDTLCNVENGNPLSLEELEIAINNVDYVLCSEYMKLKSNSTTNNPICKYAGLQGEICDNCTLEKEWIKRCKK